MVLARVCPQLRLEVAVVTAVVLLVVAAVVATNIGLFVFVKDKVQEGRFNRMRGK